MEEKEIRDIGVDLVEKHFPKGECKERGAALVLYAELIIAFEEWHKQALIEARIEENEKYNFYGNFSPKLKAEERIAQLKKELE